MEKVVFIKENYPEIRNKLKKAGFTICICAEFLDAIWLNYHPDEDFPYDIHGEGYAEIDSCKKYFSPIERIKMRLKEDCYYPVNREFFNTVEEFLEKYKVVSDQPVC